MGLILLAIAVSLDGMWAGLAEGLRSRRMGLWQLVAVGVESALGSTGAMAAGAACAGSLGDRVATCLAAALFLGIALWNFREGLRNRRLPAGFPEGPLPALLITQARPCEWGVVLLMGASVAVDASLAACALAIGGCQRAAIPPLFGLTHIVLVGGGNIVGYRLAAHGARRPLGAVCTAAGAAHPAPAAPEPNAHVPAKPYPPATRTPELSTFQLGTRLAPGLIFLVLGLTRLVHGLGC